MSAAQFESFGISTRKTIRKRSSKSTPDMDALMQISEMVLPADMTLDEIVAECKAARKELYDRQQNK